MLYGKVQEASAVQTLTVFQQIVSKIRKSNSAPLAASERVSRVPAWIAACALVGAATCSAMAQVPAVVATGITTLAPGFSAGPAVLDACGNIYVYEGGGTGVVQINASTKAVTVVAKNTQGYTSSGTALYMDPAKKFMYFPDFNNFYTTHFDQVAIVNCTPGAVNATFANNLGNLGNYYWGTVQDAAGDAAGDVFFNTTSNVTKAIYKETFSSGASTYADSQIITWKNDINHIAADAAGDVFFTDKSTQDVYALILTAGAYAATPVVLAAGTSFGNVTGLSFDPLGNLYIADGKANLVFEVPLEKGVLNPVDMFAVASVGVPYKVAVDASHNIYASNYGPGATKVSSGSVTAPATAYGVASGTFPVTYVFNAPVTPTAITTFNSTSTASVYQVAAAAKGACAVGTLQAPQSSCAVNLTFTPTAIGNQKGAVAFTSASGTVTSNLAGIGLGAAATIDPGTVMPATTMLTAPSGITVDSLGNVFVTDTTANTLTEFAAGSKGVGTTVSTGTIKLSGPKAVAVDTLGDIFIADSGNNRIVEVPVVNGVLTSAATSALAIPLKNPQGIAVDAAGNLYIADTGNNNLLFIPSINGVLTFSAAQSFGTGLSGPGAIALDQSGNLYLAETGSNDVLEFTAPIGSSAQIKVASGFTNPTGVATDAGNSLYVVDSGSGSIVRYAGVGGNLGAKSVVGGSVISPIGVATDASGNLYVTDTASNVVAEIKRVVAALQFGGVNVGSTGTQTSAINSSGNQPLTFPKADYTVGSNAAAGFAVTGDTCSGATFNPGAACAITGSYTPAAPQLNAEEDLTFASNASNGTTVLQLIGTGARITPSTVTLVLTNPAGATSLSSGQSVTFTATIGTGTNPAVPGGSVKFFVNGAQVGTVAVKNASAALTLKNGLPAGMAVVVMATYTGDVINYSGSSGQLTEVVNALADSIALTVTAPFVNPLSANDDAANAAGPSIPLVATITPSSTIAPSGTVSFFAGTTNIGVVSVVPGTGGVYTATLVTTSLRAGTTNSVENGSYLSNYAITAVYSGDFTYYGVTSAAQTIAIVGANKVANLGNTTGAFFTLSPTNPTITVASSTAGGPASSGALLTFTSYGGWSGVLNFTCSGLPAYSTCTTFPGSPVVLASTAASLQPPTTINLVITTNVPPLVPTASSLAWWAGGLGGLMLLGMRRRIARLGYLRGGQWASMAGMLLLLVSSVFGMSACSSTNNLYPTPTGTSAVTVTVRGAQLVPTKTDGSVQTQDVNVPALKLTLVVQ
jgi:sugar lactone lactonase YvrE